MHRIDGAGATVDNKFTQGNPVTAVPATTVTDAWLNAVQEEIAAVIAGAGIALDKPNNGQLLQALGKLTSRTVDSIAALKAVDKTKTARAFVAGYYAAGDGGGGAYWYDAADTTSADNGGTLIVATDGARWKLIDSSLLNARRFGLKGDGGSNDGARARALFDAFGSFGGAFRLSRGTYCADASMGSAVSVTKPVSVFGDGGVYTAINPSLAAGTDNTMSVTPSAAYDYTLLRFSGFSLHDPATGSRTGNHGVFLDTQVAGAQLPKFTMRDVAIGDGSNPTGWGVYHLNNIANNANGGLYAALFENNAIKGGVRLENSGDSVAVVHNVLSGDGVGVWASLVPGASLLEIQANNITTSGGAIRIEYGSRFRVLGNNIEHFSAGSAANNNSAVINITGLGGLLYGGVIKENLVSSFGLTDATALVRLRNCRGTLVEDNVLLSGSATTTIGIDIGADCHDVRVGANTFNAGVTTQVLDAGVGTMGVIKTAALQNGWVAYGAGQAALKYIKTSAGMVHMYGAVKGGVTASGTLIATLPEGFRPGEIVRAPCFTELAGVPSIAEVTIETDGALRFNYAKTDQVNVSIAFPAAKLANAVALE